MNPGTNQDAPEAPARDTPEATKGEAPPCVLMFSGGRDSTLSAIRLATSGYRLQLLTTTVSHIHGIESVIRRLHELRPHLPLSTQWLWATYGPGPLPLRSRVGAPQTCLPCQHLNVVAGVRIARAIHARFLALGFTTYQSSWLEQSPYAVGRLSAVLRGLGLTLLLPVYNLTSKHLVLDELAARGLTTDALEQKCLIQHRNPPLDDAAARSVIDNWSDDIHTIVQSDAKVSLDIRQYSLDALPTANGLVR